MGNKKLGTVNNIFILVNKCYISIKYVKIENHLNCIFYLQTLNYISKNRDKMLVGIKLVQY